MEDNAMEATPTQSAQPDPPPYNFPPPTQTPWDQYKISSTVLSNLKQTDDTCYITGLCTNNRYIATSNSYNVIKIYNITDFSLEGELTGKLPPFKVLAII